MTSQQDYCGCKIGRTAAEYALSDADSWLVDEWEGGTSVRQLTEEFNKRIIASALKTANVGGVKWTRAPVYEALQTEELSEAEELEIRREFNRAGVDTDALSADLVSHQTVYRHLTRCLGATKDEEQTPETRREKARDTVYALQQRTETVTESTIESLRTADVIDLKDTEILVSIQVVCNSCGRSMDFETAIDEGCDCHST